MTFKTLIAILVGALFALNAADYILTIWMLNLGGVEINPVMAPIIHTPFGLIVKIVGVGFFGIMALLATNTKLALALTGGVTVYYAAIVAWNTGQIVNYYA